MLNESEQKRLIQLRSLVGHYEDAPDNGSREAVLEKIREYTDVSEYELSSYYGWTDLDGFCATLAIEVVRGVELTKNEAVSIVKQVCDLSYDDFEKIDYLERKYGDAVDYVLRKSDVLDSVVNACDRSFNLVMEQIDSDEGGPIAL